MVQTIVIVSKVRVGGSERNPRLEERRSCFPNPLPDNPETRREVAQILRRGSVRFLDGNGMDIANSADVARLVDAVKPFMREPEVSKKAEARMLAPHRPHAARFAAAPSRA